MKVHRLRDDLSVSFLLCGVGSEENGRARWMGHDGFERARIVLLTLGPALSLLHELRFCSYQVMCMLLANDAGLVHGKERSGHSHYTLFFSHIPCLRAVSGCVRPLWT